MSPRRIQMTRHKPWRADNPDAVIVDRRTAFGNPFVVGRRVPRYPDGLIVRDGRHATQLYRDWILRSNPADSDEYDVNGWIYNRREVERQMWRLVGHDLACWCPPHELGEPDDCHGDWLLWLCNYSAAVPPTEGAPR